jgi:hypothetical protein
MGSLQKTRMFVFSLFFVALIIFAGLRVYIQPQPRRSNICELYT